MNIPAPSLAARLAAARLDGTVVTAGGAEHPATLAAAYAVQRDVAARLGPASGVWKVGSTSAEAQARLGTTEPGAARVPARFRFRTGDSVPVHAAHDLWVEAEFALRLGADLPPRAAPYTKPEVAAAIDGVAPALEIVGSRLSGGLTGAGRLLVTADGGANVALVTGAVAARWREFDLPGHAVRLRRNGVEAAAGTGARALGDPVNVLLWIANFQRLRDGLRAGELVSTGTCTGLVRVGPDDALAGDFGDIGTVDARLAAGATG
ncbi:MAG: fumarylacetoacetate hydrolase family protein [Alphaproteobacteria bacterium]